MEDPYNLWTIIIPGVASSLIATIIFEFVKKIPSFGHWLKSNVWAISLISSIITSAIVSITILASLNYNDVIPNSIIIPGSSACPEGWILKGILVKNQIIPVHDYSNPEEAARKATSKYADENSQNRLPLFWYCKRSN